MFEGFELKIVHVASGEMRVRHGGSGPPVLLLHGHPRTHMTWGRVADLLSPHFTVVCPDLPGFGRSYQPVDAPDHRFSSKREKANACVELMAHLGYGTFAVAGHDRGSYVAFRMALDHPDIVSKMVVIDSVPILEALERADEKFARLWWHWFFFSVPEKPERAILAEPLAWYNKLGPEQMGEEAYNDLLDVIHDPHVVHGMIEDYRAGHTVDREHDLDDRRAGRRIHCPTLCLWSSKDDMEELYSDPLDVWRPWLSDFKGHSIDSGHHVAEEAPKELARALLSFLR
ncbi:alpha/beta fold hydrolase [Rhizobium mongolense]|uniref:alpha/beta fold hydrolase n=1 Tax=Rhizobium TaxID=379 RepID=UPI0024B0F7A3|nr:alpha/beta hydrolase [Rhizobium sp. CC1099]WFU91830.1 alpha/beta hydrolase [Rhizobium sp. CC1099]